ncbi:MAG TPA: hypothetical protein VFX22_00770 [Candidatus Kapabacteria bacterium]|nr:hypothetical protein [Candidatus Kapabacteria bacterium]
MAFYALTEQIRFKARSKHGTDNAWDREQIEFWRNKEVYYRGLEAGALYCISGFSINAKLAKRRGWLDGYYAQSKALEINISDL